jgi:hypothetical protein
MVESKRFSPEDPALAQAAVLLQLVDLEARWENLRDTPTSAPGSLSLGELQKKQNAHRLFQEQLAVYNRRYTPAHIPELLLNTPARLGKWCQRMRELCLRVEQSGQGQCPDHLVEKAYRRADKLARRLGKAPVPRQTVAGTLRNIVSELEKLGKWCNDLDADALSA